jgi:hypothetical protein
MAIASLAGLPNEVWIKILENLRFRDLLPVSLVSKKARELAFASITELDSSEDFSCQGRGGIHQNYDESLPRLLPVMTCQG